MPLRGYGTNFAPQVKKNSLPTNCGIHMEIAMLLTKNTTAVQKKQMIMFC